MNEHTTFEISNAGVAVIKLDSQESSVNLLSSAFLKSLDGCLAQLSERSGVRCVVICSLKKSGFIAGADLKELQDLQTADDAMRASRKGQALFHKIAAMKVPVIAAINGHCMGGGTELALACDFRIAAKEKADIALPEVKLGIFPGWGGTQRLPRLISFQKALEMILSGKGYSAEKAYRCGLVDMVVPDAILNSYAEKFAEEIIRTRGRKYKAARRKKARGGIKLLTDKNFIGRFFTLWVAKRQVVKRTSGHYPAPLLAIKAIQRGLNKSLEEGLEIEARFFGEAVATSEHKNLLHVFWLRERAKNRTGVDLEITFEEPRNIGILGAGVMGGALAQLLAYKDYSVSLKDIDDSMLLNGLEHADSLFEDLLKERKLTVRQKRRKMEKIYGTLRYDGFRRSHLVIEAVAEKMDVKKKVLQEIERYIPPNAIFATNTSALSVTELQSVAKNPGRVCGMHFFNPVHKMPLVEVIQGKETDEGAIAAVFDLAVKLGKVPVLVQDSPGFLVNRLLGVYLNEACTLAEEGYDFEWIDSLVKEFGMPMGPFRLMDEVGLDIAAEVSETLGEAFQNRLEPSSLLNQLRKTRLLGKKGKKGFYIYRNNRRIVANPTAKAILGEGGRENGEEAIQRLMYIMVNEAARCLSEGIVKAPHDVDAGMVFGTGFPPFRGGLLKWADACGIGRIALTLRNLSDQLGDRFFPEPMLLEKDAFY